MIFLKLTQLAARIKTERIRITAFLLSILLLSTTIPPVAFAEGTCICPDDVETHWATCPLYTCPDCGASDCYGDCPDPDENPDAGEGNEPGTGEGEDPGTGEGNEPGTGEGDEPGTGEGDEPGTGEGNEPGTGEGEDPGTGEGEDPGTGEGDEPSVNPDLCDICGSDPCTCPDYVFHVGKIAALNPDGAPLIFVTEDAPDEDWTEYCLDFYPEDFSTDVLFRIDDYKVVSESVSEDIVAGIAETPDEGDESISSQTLESLWYQVHIVKGSAIDSFTDGSWIFQNYLDDDPAYDTLLIGEHEKCPICGEYDCETEHVKCPACGEYDCTTEHVKCDICGGWDCHHTWCGVCGDMDCTADHVYCYVCKDYDCGLEHEIEPEEEPFVHPTEPVIPTDPQLPDDYEVAILDENGNLVSAEDGITLQEGFRTSVSAWSPLDGDVAYQWQICYDEENDLWVDIAGQSGKGILFSSAMLEGVLADNDNAYIRCVISSETEAFISEPICITMDDADTMILMDEVDEEESVTLWARLVTFARSLFSLGGVAPIDDSNYVTITIKYLTAESFKKQTDTNGDGKIDEDDEPEIESAITQAHTASIPKGDPYKPTIVAPVYTGYAPFWDRDAEGNINPGKRSGDGKIWTGSDYYLDDGTFPTGVAPDHGESESALEMKFNLDSVTEDLVFYVYYLPIEVNMGVRYYFQNLNDDYYTEDVSRYYPDQMRTGSKVSDDYLEFHAGDTMGFTRMYHQPEDVAADGSTTFRCYYDRNYYLVNFDLDGGYGVQPVYARYDAPILAGTPQKAGYEFLGWNLLTTDTNGDGVLDAGDNELDDLPAKIPAGNRKYKAVWTPSGTVPYNVAYWILDNAEDTDHSDDVFIGNVFYKAEAGKTISDPQVLTSDTPLCGMEEHYHTSECQLVTTCGETPHTHTLDDCYEFDCKHTHTIRCYTTSNSYTEIVNRNSLSYSYQRNAYDKLLKSVSSPQSGYVYRVRYNNTNYNFFYLNSTWYYLGTGNTVSGITSSISGNPSNNSNTANSSPATLKCTHTHSLSEGCYDLTCTTPENDHVHTDACSKSQCGKQAHVHNETDCPTMDTSQLVFVRADEDVKVMGDGTTVINAYYTYQKYTLRFYYARSSTTAGLEVVGGTSYPFGTLDSSINQNSSVANLLNAVTQWGKVKLPTGESDVLNAEGKARVASGDYRLGTYSANGYTYSYLEFTAAYGDCLEELWPVDVFSGLPLNESHSTHSGKCPTQAYFSAWNGEFKVKYTQDNSNRLKGKNETIKGLYMYLDDSLIYDSTYSSRYTTLSDGSRLVNYLGFWDNGANVSWSLPRLHSYHLWVEPLEGEDYGSTQTYGQMTGDTSSPYANYVLYRKFNVYDDSDTFEAQTATTLDGYTYLGGHAQALTSTDAVLPYVDYDQTIAKDMYATTAYASFVDHFFYARNASYVFVAYNQGSSLGFVENVIFDTRVKSLLDTVETNSGKDLFTGDDYKPAYPTSLEEGGYYFDGWYTTSTGIAGTKIDLENDTLPAGNMAIYAIWRPVPRTVTFFYHYEYLEAYLEGKSSIEYNGRTIDFVTGEYGMKQVDTVHGKTLDQKDIPVLTKSQLEPENENMHFVNWFYMEDGQKKAYAPEQIPVRSNLLVYAEWRDGTAQPYQVNYVLKGPDRIPVAESTFGYADFGILRTFSAKAGYPYNELYDLRASGGTNYNVGHFPLQASHSFVIQDELPENYLKPVVNTYTFEYVPAADIQYTVRYVNKATGTLMAESVVKETDYAVVTERFKEFEGFISDAFYKSLIIAVEWDEDAGKYVGSDSNVITFYYVPSGDALYAVHHMVEKIHADDVYKDTTGAKLAAERAKYNIDGTGGYEEYGTTFENIALVGSDALFTPQIINGFNLIPGTGTNPVAVYLSGEKDGSDNYILTNQAINNDGTYTIRVTAKGAELYIFYQRQDYDYKVHYYQYNTTNPVKTSKSGTAPYQTMVKESASKYVTHDGSMYVLVSAANQSIQIRDDASQNVIIFYYSPIQYQADYYVMPEGSGSLTTTKEVFGSGSFSGSTPMEKPNYEFVGWFTNSSCTDEYKVTSAIGTVDPVTHHLTPKKLMNGDDPVTKYAFYAKFNLLAGDFTIIRRNATPGQVFVYQVRSVADPSMVIEVSAQANANRGAEVVIKDLPYGEYTVEQVNNWSWQYTSDTVSRNVKHSPGTPFVEYKEAPGIFKWLTGIGNFIRRIFGGT